ncbi:glycosyltransferase family 4 protein [Microvirga guangxiensis]|uniref:Glycosyltransferase involved in cell wall bisynthesis n=1 Tax=Microvirga guangxiensis TaxID=549386 RepID=A0A1G5CEA4_9HYPH|nr:glycosyltransferase family 4 protein [Microvirga guangxiensis]SCY00829.1 Glycosyltransferase involved in cell wall bisynthesis [Microvirga guangxiensis]
MSNNRAPGVASVRPRVVLHYWGRRGGGSLFTLLLAQHLKASQDPVDVFLSLADSNDDMVSFRATGLPILTLERPHLSTLWHAGWRLPKRLRMHANELAMLRPDVVIITMNSPFAWPFIYALQRLGIRVAYVAHDAEPHPGDYAALWQRVTQDLLLKSADQIVVLSKSVAQRVTERIPSTRSKISVLSLESVYPTKRTHLPFCATAGDPIRFLFYGRLLPYKGLDLLGQALAPLRTSPGWQLTIAGSGPLEAEIRHTFSEWPQVELELGWISNERTMTLYSTHHLLLCPYTEASQSGVVAEALSWAMPCLVMPSGALPEQIGFGTAGVVAETVDAASFRRSVQIILEEPGRLAELSSASAKLLIERQSETGWIDLSSNQLI